MGFGFLLPLLLAVYIGLVAQRKTPLEPPRFVEVADGVYRLTQWWYLVPGVPPVMPVAVGLLRQGSSWVLVDAGCKDNSRQAHATDLLAALRDLIPTGEKLTAIALTHGHTDHVGALPELLEAFPDAPVVVHASEAPFLTGAAQYLPPGSPTLRLWRLTGLDWPQFLQVPAGRLRLLEGEGGDLGAWGAHFVEWAAAQGHTPGHTVFTHRDSGVLFAGDAISLIKPSVSLDWARSSKPPEDSSRVIASYQPVPFLPRLTLSTNPHFICYEPRCDPQASERTLCVLLRRTLQYRLLVAGHDTGAGALTRQQVEELVPQAGAQLPMLPGLDCAKFEEEPIFRGGAHAAGGPAVSSEL